jgi:hypothetical protein
VRHSDCASLKLPAEARVLPAPQAASEPATGNLKPNYDGPGGKMQHLPEEPPSLVCDCGGGSSCPGPVRITVTVTGPPQ